VQIGTIVRVVVAVVVLALGVGAYVSLGRYYDLPGEEVAKKQGPSSENPQRKMRREPVPRERPRRRRRAWPSTLGSWLLATGYCESAYDLLASESKKKVSRHTYTAFFNAVGAPQVDLSFSSAEARGDKAKLAVNRTIQFEGQEPEKDRRTQRLVREDGAWRVVLDDETLKLFAQFAEQPTAASTASSTAPGTAR
jgi:hypothetical protein